MSEPARKLIGQPALYPAADLLAAEQKGFTAGARQQREADVSELWKRIEREEYGHAKAAVALDIEAVEAAPLVEWKP